MKKRKLVFLLLAVFILSGCEVKYNITLHNGKISEEIIIPYDADHQESYDREFYYDILNNQKYSSGIELIEKENKFVLRTEEIDITNIRHNDLYNFCYDTIDVLLEDDIYYIGTSSNFECMSYDYLEVDTIEINITTYNKVIQSNADKKHFNTYTWIIDRENSNDKNITFLVSKNEYVWYYNYRGLFIGLAGVLVIVLIALVIVAIFKRKSNKVNRI